MLRTRRSASYSVRRRGPFRRFLDVVLAIAILGMLVLVAARLDRVEQRSLQGQPHVADGDSLTLEAERVRLRGLDAPELTQICQRSGVDYACGRDSRDALLAIIAGRQVICRGWERDRYGRLLANCFAGQVEINRQLVRSGWAVAYGDFGDEERVAREAGAGLWAGTFDRPTNWRARHGGMAEGEHDLLATIVNWLRQVLRI